MPPDHGWREPDDTIVIPAHAGIQGTRDVKCYCVYILASKKNGTVYTSVTGNLLQRVHQHKDAEMPGFTSRYGVSKLVYFETFTTISAAINREKCIKKWRRKWKVELIEQHNPDWKDLYGELAGETGFPLARE